jgi:hypothetical protein
MLKKAVVFGFAMVVAAGLIFSGSSFVRTASANTGILCGHVYEKDSSGLPTTTSVTGIAQIVFDSFDGTTTYGPAYSSATDGSYQSPYLPVGASIKATVYPPSGYSSRYPASTVNGPFVVINTSCASYADNVYLQRSATTSSGAISGSVYDSLFNIITGTTVSLYKDSMSGSAYQTSPSTVGAYSFTGLPYGTYYIKATRSGYVDAWSGATIIQSTTTQTSNVLNMTANVTTPPVTTPAAPTNLRAEPAATATTIYLKWDDNSTNEDKFILERKLPTQNWGDTTIAGLATFISANNSTTASYTDGASAGTTYVYRVQACLSGYGCSAYSSELTVTTPSSTSGGGGGGSSVSSTGAIGGAVYDGSYNILQGAAVSLYKDSVGGTAYQTSSGTSGSYNFTNLPYGTYYVKATKSGYMDAVSGAAYVNSTTALTVNVSMALPNTTGTAPATPSGLAATVSGSNVALTWTDNSNNETGFKVYRGPTWTDIGNTGMNVPLFTDSSLATGTYTYKVQAFVGTTNPVYSNTSNEISVTVGGGASASYGSMAGQIWTTGYVQQIYGATVYLYNAASATTAYRTQAISLSAYNYVFNDLPYGTYYIKATKAGYSNSSLVAVSINTSALVQTNLTLGASTTATIPGNVWGCVKDANGQPVSGAVVKVFTDSARTTLYTTANTAFDGCYNLGSISPVEKTYYLRVESGNYSDEKSVVLTSAMPAVEQGFVMPVSTATIVFSGYVKDAAGSLLSGAKVALYKTAVDRSAGNIYLYALSGTGGDFSISTIPSGTYYVRVSSPATRTDLLYLDETLVIDTASKIGVLYRLNAAVITPVLNESNGMIIVKLFNTNGLFEKGSVVLKNNAGTFKKESGLFLGEYTFSQLPYDTYTAYVAVAAAGITTSSSSQAAVLTAANPFALLKFGYSSTATTKVKISGTLIDGETGTAIPGISNASIKIKSKTTGEITYGYVTDSAYSLDLAPDSYSVIMDIPYNFGYYFVPIDATLGSTAAVTTYNLKLFRNAYLIYGNFITASMATIKPIPARANIVAIKDGQSYLGKIDYAAGSYKIKVPNAGTYTVSPVIDESQGYFAEGKNISVTISETAVSRERQQDILVVKSTSIIKGKVLRPDGMTSLAGAWVSIDRFSSLETSSTTQLKSIVSDNTVGGGLTDNNGSFEIFAPWGTYYIHAYMLPESGYINPGEQKVVLSSSGQVPSLLALTAREQKIVVSGKVTKSDGTAVAGAFVDAWSDKNGYSKALSLSDGSYQMKVGGNDTWHLKARQEENLSIYSSTEVTVAVGASSVSADLVLVREKSLLPDIAKITYLATQFQSVETTDGARVEAPSGSIVGSGEVNLSLAPTAEAPEQGVSKPVGLAYDVTATVNNVAVKTLSSEVTIRIPYVEVDLTSAGVTPEQLTPSYYDDAAGVWRKADRFSLDKTNKFFLVYTSHLTRFALLMPADVTPPPFPSNITIQKSGTNALLVSWGEPTYDYHHTRIYRSTTAGTMGQLVYDNLIGGTKLDTGIVSGTTYYYVVRSVDGSGNESTNTTQVLGSLTGSASSTTVNEGDLVMGPDGITVYIVNGKGFKRHIFNPAVFSMYKHFKWNEVKKLDQAALDTYKSSDLYRASGDTKVFSLFEVDMAKGIAQKRWLDMTADQFIQKGYSWDQIFEINPVERDYYGSGTPLSYP